MKDWAALFWFHENGPESRLLTLAAASWSFDRAASLLKEFCGIALADNTIRRHGLEVAGEMREWQRQSPAVQEQFQQAKGVVEFSTAGTCVNTLKGWRETRLAVFAKRPAGKTATPAEWDKRSLPKPTARMLFGGIWKATQYEPQWRAWAGRLGINQTSEITVLADGAKWIWNQVERQLPGAAGLLDIYHASEHLYGRAKVLFGEGTTEGKRWLRARRQTLLQGGVAALNRDLERQQRPTRSPTGRRGSRVLMNYFHPHVKRTHYCQRLAEGRGIGMTEGACKTVLKRLKQAGARWRVRHAERMVALRGLTDGDFWNQYWQNQGG